MEEENELARFRTRLPLSRQSDPAIAIDLIGFIDWNNFCQRWIRYLPDVPYKPRIERLVVDPVGAGIATVESNGRDIGAELCYGCNVAPASNDVLP